MKKQLYIDNMKSYLKQLNATNEQSTIILNIYTSYLDSFYKRVEDYDKVDAYSNINIFNNKFKQNISDLMFYSKKDEEILNFIQKNKNDLCTLSLNEEQDLVNLRKSILNNTYNREIYCLTKCFEYKKFQLELYALANILGMKIYEEDKKLSSIIEYKDSILENKFPDLFNTIKNIESK